MPYILKPNECFVPISVQQTSWMAQPYGEINIKIGLCNFVAENFVWKWSPVAFKVMSRFPSAIIADLRD